MWYIYTKEYYSSIKGQNNATCSNMDVTRDFHSKWSNSERQRQIFHVITYLWNLKYGTNEPMYKIETYHSHGKQTCWLPGGKGWEWDLVDENCYLWNGWAMGSYCIAQGTVCDWVTLLYTRNWINSVNQLFHNKHTHTHTHTHTQKTSTEYY